jgi:hypothetical protein
MESGEPPSHNPLKSGDRPMENAARVSHRNEQLTTFQQLHEPYVGKIFLKDNIELHALIELHGLFYGDCFGFNQDPAKILDADTGNAVTIYCF